MHSHGLEITTTDVRSTNYVSELRSMSVEFRDGCLVKENA